MGCVGGRRPQRGVERHRDESGRAATAVLGGEHQVHAAFREPVGVVQILTAARAIEQARASRHAAIRASARVANGARPTPPATIHAVVGGSTSGHGCPSGPRHPSRSPTRTSNNWPVPVPMRLLRMLMPCGVPSAARTISKIEKGRRSRGSSPGFVLIMTNWPGRAAAAIVAARQRDDVVLCRERTIPEHVGLLVHDHPRQHSASASCRTCDC